jgi:hypothetical protein
MVGEDPKAWTGEEGKSLAASLLDHGVHDVSDSSRLSFFIFCCRVILFLLLEEK